MYKVIDEWKIGVRDYLVITLNERIPEELHKKIRIKGKEYAINLTHYSGESEDILDAASRNIIIKTSEVGFIGKDVEFI